MKRELGNLLIPLVSPESSESVSLELGTVMLGGKVLKHQLSLGLDYVPQGKSLSLRSWILTVFHARAPAGSVAVLVGLIEGLGQCAQLCS